MSSENKYPLIGISKFKINNSLIIGSGSYLLELIYGYLELMLRDVWKYENLDFFITESFCSYELCFVLFSDSYEEMTKFLINLRGINFANLEDANPELYGKIEFDTLLNSLDDSDEIIIKNAHVFAKTHTVFGYDIEWKNNNKKFLPLNINADKIQVFNHWDVKPGHLKNFKKLCDKYLDISDNYYIPIGKGVIVTKAKISNNKLPDIFESFQENKNYYSINEIDDHIDKVKTYVNIILNREDIFEKDLDEKHLHITKKLDGFAFKKKELKDIHDILVRNRISQVLQDRVLRMFRNFNDGILDSILFGFFIELKGFLLDVQRHILNIELLIEEESLNSWLTHDFLGEFVNIFEKAYNNRFHQSYKMVHHTDVNLDYSGAFK